MSSSWVIPITILTIFIVLLVSVGIFFIYHPDLFQIKIPTKPPLSEEEQTSLEKWLRKNNIFVNLFDYYGAPPWAVLAAFVVAIIVGAYVLLIATWLIFRQDEQSEQPERPEEHRRGVIGSSF